jgi:hypothetical protein
MCTKLTSYTILKRNYFCLHADRGVGVATHGNTAYQFIKCLDNTYLNQDHSNRFVWSDNELLKQASNKHSISRPTVCEIQEAIHFSTPLREYCLTHGLIRVTAVPVLPSYTILKPSSFCLFADKEIGVALHGPSAEAFINDPSDVYLNGMTTNNFCWMSHRLTKCLALKEQITRPTLSMIHDAIHSSTSFREYCLSKELISVTTAAGCDCDIDKPVTSVGAMHSNYSILKPSSFCLYKHDEVGVVSPEHLAGDVFSRYPGNEYLNDVTSTRIPWMGYEMYSYSSNKHSITRPTEAQVISTLIAHPTLREYCIEQGLVSVTSMHLADPLDDIAAGLADFRTRINTDVKAHRIAVNIHVEYITEIKKLQCALQMYQTRLIQYP